MEAPVYKSLDLKKIDSKKSVFISTEEALKDIIKIDWDEDVLKGNKQVVLIDKK